MKLKYLLTTAPVVMFSGVYNDKNITFQDFDKDEKKGLHTHIMEEMNTEMKSTRD